MKMFKKLVPAIALLVLSAAMVVTSSFAWFSMNTSVSATGMQIKAQAAQIYMQIQNHGVTFTNDSQITVVAANTTATLSPTNVHASFNATTQTPYAGGKDFVWVTALSKDPNVSTKYGEYSKLNEITPSHALINEFDIRLNPAAGVTKAEGMLRVTGVTMTTDTTDDARAEGALADCVSVLIVNEATEQSQLWKQTSPGAFALVDGSDTNLSDDTYLENGDNDIAATVKVYVFFDGDNAACVTNNVINANGYTVAVSFDCTLAVA